MGTFMVSNQPELAWGGLTYSQHSLLSVHTAQAAARTSEQSEGNSLCHIVMVFVPEQ